MSATNRGAISIKPPIWKNMEIIKMNKKLHVVGPYNCPARRNLICLISGEECHMLVGVECIFFDYELRELGEKKRQLRLQKPK